ncbi:MAG: T9SS type A sorting domain-containing protein, partial [candidate division WOR-3 bacterium]
EVIFNLPVQAGQRFYLCWHFGSDPAVNSYPGWYLDDISGIGFAYALPLQNDVGVRAIVSPGQYHFVNNQLYPKAWIKNYGLTNQNNIPVVCSIFGAGNLLRYYLTANILSLPANDSILLTFQTWTPTDIETCRVVINTFLSNDENPLNNRKTRLTYIANTIDIIIGNGTSSSSMYPIYNYYAYSVTEALYRQEEINFYGYISKLAYYKSSGTAIYPIENVQIYMKLTTETSLASGSYDTTGYTLVYNGSFTNNATSGWMEIELDVPFLYDNSYNLKILVIKGPPAVTSGYPSWRYTSTSPTYCNRYGYGSSLPTTLSQTYSRPDVRFTFTSAGQAQFDVGVHSIISPPTRHLVNTILTPSARIKNYGTLTQINIPVVCSIYGRNGVVRYTNSDIIPLLNSNQIITVNFTPYTPTNVETCLVVFRTLLANDSNPTNDSRSVNTIITNSLEIIIGTGTSGSSLYFLYGYNNYAASEAIYLQNEIGYPGYITNLAYYKTAGSNTTQFDDVRIYMKHTQASTIATGPFDTTDYTLVYQGILPFYAIGWMDVQLTTPFLYNNTDNLQVLALKGPPAISSGYPSWQYTSLSPNYRNRYGYSNSGWPTSLSQSYYRPNIRITLSPSAPGITQNQLTLPTITMLNNVKPNPIRNNHIHISYTIAQRTHVLLNIYDASGRLIKNLVNNYQDQGTYDCIWTTTDQNNQAVKPGIYFYTLQTDNYRETKKLILSR